jgi:LexA-binding, inner membrane-associated putative hydrolase
MDAISGSAAWFRHLYVIRNSSAHITANRYSGHQPNLTSMIIGHLPAGYVASKLLFPWFEDEGITIKKFLWAGIFGAIAPDLDMGYFHLSDHRQNHHHTYFTHFPILWASLLLISVIWFYMFHSKANSTITLIFSLNGFIHMLLDSIVGDIWWFAPFIDKPFAIATVQALYKPWWLNFLLHWSFALELALVVWALCLLRHGSNYSFKKNNP